MEKIMLMCFLAVGLLPSAQAQVTTSDSAWKIDYSTRFPEAPEDAGFTVYVTPNDIKFQIHGETGRYFLANEKDTVQAQSIEKVKVAGDFFKIPKGYKIRK